MLKLMKRLFFVLFLILIPLELCFLYIFKTSAIPGDVAGIKKITSGYIDNSASIGEFGFNLFGYTSPYALVTIDGMGVYDTTTANDKGYFQFNNRFFPLSSNEACLSSKDQFGRISSPVCLPPFPTNRNTNIGPVIMPPTISLNKRDYFLGDEIVLSGQAVPSTEVKLSVFGDNLGKLTIQSIDTKSHLDTKGHILNKIAYGISQISNLIFVKPVEAFTFPQLETQSDNKGNFSVNLPSSNPEKFRMFAQTNYKKNVSPNSIKLSFDVLPIWMIIVKFLLYLFSLIRSRLLELLIVAEVLYILYIIKSHLFNEKAIVLYRNHLPLTNYNKLPTIMEDKSLVKH
jgi:hypothetical protein